MSVSLPRHVHYPGLLELIEPLEIPRGKNPWEPPGDTLGDPLWDTPEDSPKDIPVDNLGATHNTVVKRIFDGPRLPKD